MVSSLLHAYLNQYIVEAGDASSGGGSFSKWEAQVHVRKKLWKLFSAIYFNNGPNTNCVA